MEIYFDARQIQNCFSGLGRFTSQILKELLIFSRGQDRLSITILLDKPEVYENNFLLQEALQFLGENSVRYTNVAPFSFGHHLKISHVVNNSDCDLYFYPHFDPPIFVRKPTIFVVHDLFPLLMKDYILKYRRVKIAYFYLTILSSLIRKNQECIAVSKCTKNDILRFFGNFDSTIRVVYEGFNLDSKTTENISPLQTNRFLLYVGDRRPHKNLNRMIDIFEILSTHHNYPGKFIIVGSPKNYDFDLDAKTKANPKVEVYSNISDRALAGFYDNCESLFFISKYEGFGLPVLEAGFRGKKIIASNQGALPEILPDWGIALKLSNSNELLAEQIQSYLDNQIVINPGKYRLAFNWKTSMKEMFAEAFYKWGVNST